MGRESCVGILVPHSADTLVAILGVLKAGAAYVPLDVEHPPARLHRVVRHAGVSVVLTTAAIAPLNLLRGAAPTLQMSPGGEDFAQWPADCPDVVVRSDDIAYVIYTSGSTGAPKGAVISHRALVNYVWWANEVYLSRGPQDFALHTSLAFDLTVTSIFCPLSTGGAINTYPPVDGQPAVLAVLEEDRSHVVKLTPSHLAMVVTQPLASRRLRTFIVGGERLDTSLARRVHERFNGRVAIFNEYGPTEATVGCMWHRFDPVADRRASVPIGRPAANTRIYVLDPSLAPVDQDVVGQMFIAGDGLAKGYLGEPAATDAAFIPDPFHAGERMYRTGDLARHLPEGGLEFVGRDDDEVKIAGHRIALGDVQHVMLQHPHVRDCCIRRVTGPDERPRIVADYVAEGDVDNRDLRAFATARLIRAAVPAAFVRHDSLPLTVNGKVDVRALPGLSAIVDQLTVSDQAPVTATERSLAGIWRSHLRVETVGRHSNFFELGGDSIIAVSVFADIEAVLGVRLPISTLVQNSTIEQLAAAIDGRRFSSGPSPIVELRAGAGHRAPLFMVHGIGGEVLSYEPVVRHFASDRAVYGLRADSVAHPPGEPLHIEMMAASYVQTIRLVRSTGPYHLCGYSAGGLVAFEMARQLVAAGERVGSLVVIDGDGPQWSSKPRGWTASGAVRGVRNAGYWIADDFVPSAVGRWRGGHDPVGHVVRGARRRIRQLARRASHDDVRDRLGVSGMPDWSVPWLEAYADAIARYRPHCYHGRLTLIRARTFGLFRPVLHDRGWTPFATDVDVLVMKGDHASIVREPLAATLAQLIEKCLNER